jgi:hypothetical protein
MKALYRLISQQLLPPHGVALIAAKRFYFGQGLRGGAREFMELVDSEGIFSSEVVVSVSDGMSNIRDVVAIRFKETEAKTDS